VTSSQNSAVGGQDDDHDLASESNDITVEEPILKHQTINTHDNESKMIDGLLGEPEYLATHGLNSQATHDLTMMRTISPRIENIITERNDNMFDVNPVVEVKRPHMEASGRSAFAGR